MFFFYLMTPGLRSRPVSWIVAVARYNSRDKLACVSIERGACIYFRVTRTGTIPKTHKLGSVMKGRRSQFFFVPARAKTVPPVRPQARLASCRAATSSPRRATRAQSSFQGMHANAA